MGVQTRTPAMTRGKSPGGAADTMAAAPAGLGSAGPKSAKPGGANPGSAKPGGIPVCTEAGAAPGENQTENTCARYASPRAGSAE